MLECTLKIQIRLLVFFLLSTYTVYVLICACYMSIPAWIK